MIYALLPIFFIVFTFRINHLIKAIRKKQNVILELVYLIITLALAIILLYYIKNARAI